MQTKATGENVMSVTRGSFNAPSFYNALDDERVRRNLTWRHVANEAGISQSTLTRLAQGKRPDVDSLAALADWANLSVDDFIIRVLGAPEKEPTAQITTYLRASKELSAESAAALDRIIKIAYESLKDR